MKLFRIIVLLLSFLLVATMNASEACFADIDKFIINQIDSAKSSVKVCVFIYEWQPIADALINAQNRGVSVELCTDYRSVNLQNRGGDTKAQQRNIQQRMVFQYTSGIS